MIVVATGACGSAGETKPAAAKASASGAVAVEPAVKIVNFLFEPKSLTVKAGTTVKWTNGDTAVHSIKDTSPLQTPVSPDLGQGATFTITYAQPGSYSYICGIHQYMAGTVQVVA
ncbi:MAG TPA: cupredoxin domain-containing protein [Acidimicrobiales bacterium]|nr:cupredoxin domain-containing protein [Acidimicrobiales bacterium]